MSPTVTKAKRIIARMNDEELSEIARYVADRERFARQRKREAKAHAHYEKIKSLPSGARVIVNAAGYGDMPRGTGLIVDGLDERARKYSLRLKTDAGKIWRFSQASVVDYDIVPEAEFDGSKMWNRMHVNF
jgi:hypothetical protein